MSELSSRSTRAKIHQVPGGFVVRSASHGQIGGLIKTRREAQLIKNDHNSRLYVLISDLNPVKGDRR